MTDLMQRHPKIDIDTFMGLLEIITVESGRQNLTGLKLLREATKRKILRDQVTVQRYLSYGERRGLVRVEKIRDPRPFGEARYYYPTARDEQLLHLWHEIMKEEKTKHGNET